MHAPALRLALTALLAVPVLACSEDDSKNSPNNPTQPDASTGTRPDASPNPDPDPDPYPCEDDPFTDEDECKNPSPAPDAAPPPSGPLGAPRAWVSSDKRELWLVVTPSFSGEVGAYSATGSCSTNTQFFERPTLMKNKTRVFLITDSGACAPGTYKFSVDYYENGSSSLRNASFEVEATTDFWEGTPVLSSVEGSVSQTNGDLRFQASASKGVTIYQVRIYSEEGNRITACTFMDGIQVEAGDTLFDACSPPRQSGTYMVVFWGFETGSAIPYFQSLLFSFQR